MKLIAAALAIAFALMAVPAFADDTTAAVTVPWGNDLVSVLSFLQSALGVILLAAVTFAARFLPASLQAYNTAANRAAVEQLLEKAVSFAINKVEGAAKDKSLTVDVGSSVLATAAQYAIDHGPDKLIEWAGGPDALMEKILARLNLDPGADGSTVLSNAPVPAQ